MLHVPQNAGKYLKLEKSKNWLTSILIGISTFTVNAPKSAGVLSDADVSGEINVIYVPQTSGLYVDAFLYVVYCRFFLDLMWSGMMDCNIYDSSPTNV